MRSLRFLTYKVVLFILLRLPDVFYSVLFTVVFPIYKALHKKRAYGRVVRHLELARQNLADRGIDCAKLHRTTARDVFKGIYWNALESYRGLARFKSVEKRIVYENEHIIRDAIAECAKANAPIAGISIHQGAFELMHRTLCRYSEHVHLITDSVGDATFRDILKELRSDQHLTEYHPNETARLIRELFRTQGILAMVVDQGKHTKGNNVMLFGRPTTLYLRLPQKINEMGAGIVLFRTWSEKKRIVVRFEKYYPPKYDVTISGTTHKNSEHANFKTDNSPLVKDIAHEVENWIADHPEQWSWNYHGNFKAGNS